MENYSSSITVRKTSFLVVVMGLILTVASCEKIIEKDISGDQVTVVLPVDDDTVYSNKVHFKWEALKGASTYNLQIVRPAFDDIDAFVLDSNVVGEEFYQILEPGAYEFKITGENGAYQSAETGPYSIYIDSVSDLSSQFVSLISPADGIFINGSEPVNLSWQNLFAADRYEYVLKTGVNFETGSILDQNLDIVTLSYPIASSFFATEGAYFWGIKGVNLTGSSAYSSRIIYVDLTPPNDPEAVSPADPTTVSVDEEVTLKWTTGIDPGTIHSTVFSTVEIASNEAFTDFVSFDEITSDSLVHTFTTAGDYWWRVKTDDAVGNASEFYSVERKIIVE